MASEQERSTDTERLLKGVALVLVIPVLGLGLWLVGSFGWFAGNVVAPGVSLWWRLFMLGTILIPVSAAFGLVQALSNRWVPAGAWFLVMGLGAAFWGPTGQLIALASAGLGIAMLIRGMEARPRWPLRIPSLAPQPSSAPGWNRGLAITALGVATLSLVFGITGLRTGYEMSPHPDADVVMYLSLGMATLPLMGALLLWSDRRAPAVLLEVLAAAVSFATPHYLDMWPYPVAPGSPEASLGTMMRVLGTILLLFAGVLFVWSLLATRSRSGHMESPKTPKPRVDSPTSRDVREWTRSVVVVLLVILVLGGASNGLRADSRSREVERADELEQEVRQQAQVCAASAAERVPYEPHDDRPLFSEHFTNCMTEYEPYRSCSLSIPIRWCDINTGGMIGEPPGRTIDIGPYVDAALMEASGEPYDRAGELAYGRIDQSSIPLPPPDLTGRERPLSRAVTIEEAIRMKGEATWIRGVLVAQPHLGHRVLFCPQVEIRHSGVGKSIHCSFGLIPEEGVIWTDAERSFVGAIENGIPRIVRWSNVGAERIHDCVFDDHMGTAPDSEVGSCSDLESRYSSTRNFFTLYTEVYGRVVGKPRNMWTDPYLAGYGLWRRNMGYTLLAASPGDTR